MFSKLLIAAAFSFSVFTAFSQTDTGKNTNTKLIKVNNKVYMIQGKGGNIGFSFGSDGVFMVDDQYAENINQIQQKIKSVSDKPVEFLVNTHFHIDHTGANALVAESGVIIFSHDNVRVRLLEMIEKEKKKVPQEILPMVTFSEEMTFNYNGDKIFIFHVPNAHTDGDALVYFTNDNVLHAGDVFFNGKYPFIDIENGGSLEGSFLAIDKILKVINEDTKIIPGHGDIGTFKDLENTKYMLSSIYKQVTAKYLSKKTEEEVAKMTDLTKEYDRQGYGTGLVKTEDFLRIVYKEVAKEMSSDTERIQKNKEAMEKYKEMEKKLKEKNKE